MLRDIGYKYSEGRLARWLTLMAADRVDVVEGLVIDLAHLHVPNLPGEMGLKSELKYNPAGVAKKAAVVGVCLVAYLVYSRNRRSGSRLR